MRAGGGAGVRSRREASTPRLGDLALSKETLGAQEGSLGACVDAPAAASTDAPASAFAYAVRIFRDSMASDGPARAADASPLPGG